jgi:ATF/CREB family transcription factor
MSQMRDEIVNLKTLLLAHKDCPVTQQQGIGALNNMAHLMGEGGYNSGMNPYGMAMNQQQQQQQQFMAQSGMQRRAS